MTTYISGISKCVLEIIFTSKCIVSNRYGPHTQTLSNTVKMMIKGVMGQNIGEGIRNIDKKVSEYDQEIPQSKTADNPMASRERAALPSRDTRMTN